MAGPLSPDLLVGFDMTGSSCRGGVRNELRAHLSARGGCAGSGGHSGAPRCDGVLAWVEVAEEGAIAASSGLFYYQSTEVFSQESIELAPH